MILGLRRGGPGFVSCWLSSGEEAGMNGTLK